MRPFRKPVLLVLCFFTAAALAQSAPVRVRGTIEKLDNGVLAVKAVNRESLRIQLAEHYTVAGVVPASLADVTVGKFIGTATLGQRNGELVALEVLIFPEAMRGTGEGHYPWDLKPDSMMTNATVAEVTGPAKDRVLTLRYKTGEVKVLVPEGTPIVTFVPGTRSDLKPGAHIFAIARRGADGSLTAARVNVGLNGLAPPM
jgi:hypothetical protein